MPAAQAARPSREARGTGSRFATPLRKPPGGIFAPGDEVMEQYEDHPREDYFDREDHPHTHGERRRDVRPGERSAGKTRGRKAHHARSTSPDGVRRSLRH